MVNVAKYTIHGSYGYYTFSKYFKSQVVRAETSPYEKRHSPKVKRSRYVWMIHKKSSNFTDLDVPKYTLPETNSKST